LVDGPTEDRQRQHRAAAHGVHVADGIGGGDAAEVERVIDDGHEEVGGGKQQGVAIVEQPGGGIVAHLVANEQAGIRRGRFSGDG